MEHVDAAQPSLFMQPTLLQNHDDKLPNMKTPICTCPYEPGCLERTTRQINERHLVGGRTDRIHQEFSW